MPDAVVDWLLEEDQPAIRFLTLTQLLGRRAGDADVREARSAILERGWAAEILASQNLDGSWGSAESLYRPKYTSTNWMLLVLSDLGVKKSDDARVRRACERWIERFSKEDGGFGSDEAKVSHLCIAGNTARALVKFGYADHPKVKSAFQWLVDNADPKGGWSCFGGGRNLDSWEPMSAFAALPRPKWTKGMHEVVERGAEFYLERGLVRQGGTYAPWHALHYPNHYFYDLLVGLDFMTRLGYADDPRMRPAFEELETLRLRDGKWKLGPAHPYVEGAYGRAIEKARKEAPRRAPRSLTLEKPGKPSKMITLRALGALARRSVR